MILLFSSLEIMVVASPSITDRKYLHMMKDEKSFHWMQSHIEGERERCAFVGWPTISDMF